MALALSVATVAATVPPAAAVAPAAAVPGAVPAPAPAVVVRPSAAVPFAGLSPRQVKDKSLAALKTAPSYRVTGYVIGAKDKRKTQMDVYVSRRYAYAELSTPSGPESVTRIGNTVYWRYSSEAIASYKLPAELEGKWVKLSGKKSPEWDWAVNNMSPTAWEKFIAGVYVTRRGTGPKFTGVPTVRLSLPGRKGGSYYVATAGPAYPRFIVRTDKTAQFAFHEYGKPFTVDTPPQDQVIDEA